MLTTHVVIDASDQVTNDCDGLQCIHAQLVVPWNSMAGKQTVPAWRAMFQDASALLCTLTLRGVAVPSLE